MKKRSLLTLAFIGFIATAAACGSESCMPSSDNPFAGLDPSCDVGSNDVGTEVPQGGDNFGSNGLLGTSNNDDGNGTGYVCTDSGCAGYGDLSGLQ